MSTADLLEYGVDLVVVPRTCELCQSHHAVFFWSATWPSTWMCRCCWDSRGADFQAAWAKFSPADAVRGQLPIAAVPRAPAPVP